MSSHTALIPVPPIITFCKLSWDLLTTVTSVIYILNNSCIQLSKLQFQIMEAISVAFPEFISA